MIKIEVINQREIIDKHKEDITNYQRAVRDVTNKLIDSGLKVLLKESDTKDSLVYKIELDKKCFVQFIPNFFGEQKALENLSIDIYDEKILDYVKNAVNTYLNNCNGLKRVTINTYF